MRFSVVGGAGFLVDSAVLLVLTELLGLGPFIARVPSFLAAATVTWWFNRSWTFEQSIHRPMLGQWIQYLFAMKGGALVNFLVYSGALMASNTIYSYPVLGVALGSIAGLAVNYSLAARLVFKTEKKNPVRTDPGRSLDERSTWILVGFMPILFGMFSMLRGQDRNWDLLNYHLYVPYAWLEGRHGIDLAAAQMQSYFPPLIDLPYYALIQAFPGPMVAFLFGLLHALAIIPLYAIARHFVTPRLAFVLSLAGCLSTSWLSGLGTTMGDNLAALGLVLAIMLVLPIVRGHVYRPEYPAVWLSGAGLILGVFVGLKITNGIFAIALVGAFALSCPCRLKARLGYTLVLGVSALAGLFSAVGYWFLFLWAEFGNPLFPQFNQLFDAPLASSIGIADQRRLPGSFVEALSWPLKLVTDPNHFSEVGQRSVVWLLLTLGMLFLLVRQIAGRWMPTVITEVNHEERFLLLFLVMGFAIWVFTFSIFRYLVVLELLAPLALWVLIRRAAPARIGGYINPAVLSLVFIAALTGMESWGHARFASPSISVQVPNLDDPQQRILVLVGDQPQAWRLPWWPKEVAFVGLATNFPENEQFRAEALRRLQSRSGPHLAMIPAFIPRVQNRLHRVNQWLALRRIAAEGRFCKFLQGVAEDREFDLEMQPSHGLTQDQAICQFRSLDEIDDEFDLAHQNQQIAEESAELLRPYGLEFKFDTCESFSSRIGQDALPYQVCQIELRQ